MIAVVVTVLNVHFTESVRAVVSVAHVQEPVGLVEGADDEGTGPASLWTIDDHRGDRGAATAEKELDPAKAPQHAQDAERQKYARGGVTRAHHDADGRNRPDGRRGREASDLPAIAEDRSCAEKSHPGHDLGGNARRLFSSQGGRHGDHGENRRTDADEDLRAQTRCFVSLLAFESNDGAADEGHQDRNSFAPGRLDHPV